MAAATASTIGGDRPVFRAELPDVRVVWLVTGYESVHQMIVDQRFSRALAVAAAPAPPGGEVVVARSVKGVEPPEPTRRRHLVARAVTGRRADVRAGTGRGWRAAIARTPRPVEPVVQVRDE